MRGIHFYRAASNSIGFQAERRQERNAGDRMRGGDKRRRVYRIRGIQRGCRVSGGESRGTKEEHRAGSDSTGFQAGRGDRREMQEIGWGEEIKGKEFIEWLGYREDAGFQKGRVRLMEERGGEDRERVRREFTTEIEKRGEWRVQRIEDDRTPRSTVAEVVRGYQRRRWKGDSMIT
jgi:hypothetical protein